ncbi:MAG: type II toxin-antitoxin system RelE/ParE family toxin [Candidatus Diapherotrites archaeon]|nr:type II toxin-antitoxin system RelE/ParE family toxin [Candidatus Diapherotrites archaeon]
MPFEYDIDDKLKDIIEKLRKRDSQRAEILYKKIKQIVNSDEQTIEHYKNLRNELSDRKRVHIDKSFVLTFKFDKQKKVIIFLDFDHHDNMY